MRLRLALFGLILALLTTASSAFADKRVALIVANSLAFGARTGLVTVMGTIVGMVAQLSVAALGVTALFEALAQGFATLRWLGVAYLLWLGFRDWRTPAGDLSRIAPVSPRLAKVARAKRLN